MTAPMIWLVILAAALVADRLGLPGPGLAAAVVSRNKALQRGVFAAAGVAQPEYVVTDDLTTVADWAAELKGSAR